MRKTLSILFLLAVALCGQASAQLSQCAITATIYDNNGDLLSGARIVVVKVVKNGSLISNSPLVYTTNASGVATFNLPRSSVAWIWANSYGLNANGSAGVAVTVPAAASANLEELAAFSSVLTTLGDLAYGGASGVFTRLAGNTSSTAKFLCQQGNGTTSTAPGWCAFAGSGNLTLTYDNNARTATFAYEPSSSELLTALGTQSANRVLASPNGSSGAMTVRALVAADIPAGISAANIGGGAVSNTEFGYLDGVSSAIQTQIDGKAATSHTHTLSNLTQSGATTNQVAQWNGSAWAPATVATGWGTITGTLSAQTDLQAALDLKANLISPSFTTPTLGVATATSINKVAITAPATSATLTIANGKTGTFSNSITLAGTDGSTLNVGAGGTLGTAAYTATTAYEVPLTFSTGLTRSTNTVTVNASQNISTLSNLTSNGYVTTTGGTGALSISTASGILDSIGSTRGSILYRGASGWAILSPGTSGQALLSNGAGADPSYGPVSATIAIGSAITSSTNGSLLFVDSGLAQDNSNLYWNNTSKRLGVGTASPQTTFHLAGERFTHTNTGTNADTIYYVRDSASLSNYSYILYGIDATGSVSGLSYAAAIMSVGRAGSGTLRDLVFHNYDAKKILFATSNTLRGGWDSAGLFGIGTTGPTAQLDIHAGSSSTVGQIIQLASGQTARALNIRDSTATFLSGFDSAGRLEYSSGITSTTATAGAQTLPANPAGFLVITIGGTQYKVPYYAN